MRIFTRATQAAAPEAPHDLTNKEYVDARNSSAALNSHVANKSNPHAVTAAQVGAYTKAEVDAKDNAKANTSHTHTIAQVTNLQAALDAKAVVTSGTADLTAGTSALTTGTLHVVYE